MRNEAVVMHGSTVINDLLCHCMGLRFCFLDKYLGMPWSTLTAIEHTRNCVNQEAFYSSQFQGNLKSINKVPVKYVLGEDTFSGTQIVSQYLAIHP